MKLNHINLVVTSVKDAISLFEEYFSFQCIEVKGDNVIAILKGADGFILTVMTLKEEGTKFPSAFHIGFMQENDDDVLNIYEKLKKNGIDAGREPRKIRDSFGFYFMYDTFMVEVGHNLS